MIAGVMSSYENWKSTHKKLHRTSLCYSSRNSNYKSIELSTPYIPPIRICIASPKNSKPSKASSVNTKRFQRRSSRGDAIPETNCDSSALSVSHNDEVGVVNLKNRQREFWLKIVFLSLAITDIVSSARILSARRTRARSCILRYLHSYVFRRRVARLWLLMSRNINFLLALRITRKRIAVARIKCFMMQQRSINLNRQLINEFMSRIMLCQRAFRSWIAISKARFLLLTLYWEREQTKALRALRKRERTAAAAAAEDIVASSTSWCGTPERKLQRKWGIIKKKADRLCCKIRVLSRQSAAMRSAVVEDNETSKHQLKECSQHQGPPGFEAPVATIRRHSTSSSETSVSSLAISPSGRMTAPKTSLFPETNEEDVGSVAGGFSATSISAIMVPPAVGGYRVKTDRLRSILLQARSEKHGDREGIAATAEGINPVNTETSKLLQSTPLISLAERETILREHLRTTRQLYLAAITDAYRKALIHRDKGVKSLEDARRLVQSNKEESTHRLASQTRMGGSWHDHVTLSLYAMTKRLPFLLLQTASEMGKPWSMLVGETVALAVENRKALKQQGMKRDS